MKHILYKKGSIATLLSFLLMVFPSAAFSEIDTYSDDNLNIEIGQAIFEKFWVFAPSSTKSSDGLGPLYNARSCHQCHDASKADKNNIPASFVIQLSIEPTDHKMPSHELREVLNRTGFIPEPTYGKQIQTFAYPGALSEAVITITTTPKIITFPDSEIATLASPTYNFTNLGYGNFHPNMKFSPRIAPRLTGLNWLEAIPGSVLSKLADPNDLNNDGISGKINWVWDNLSNSKKIGRFGWKAGKANLEQQNLAALATDIGVSSWLFPQAEGDCSLKQRHCIELAAQTETHVKVNKTTEAIDVKEPPEASKEMTDLLLLYTSTLEQPKDLTQTRSMNKKTIKGKDLFFDLGCQNCHKSDFVIPETPSTDGIMTTKISPYTDLLLHDMGDELSDKRIEFDASGNEWRTAPLWGIATYLKETNNPRFLHDGRARSISEAILWHGGEAERSKLSFIRLSKEQRTTLINFVEGL